MGLVTGHHFKVLITNLLASQLNARVISDLKSSLSQYLNHPWGFGPFCLDLGPKGDEALRMGLRGGTDIRTDKWTGGWTDSPVFYRI